MNAVQHVPRRTRQTFSKPLLCVPAAFLGVKAQTSQRVGPAKVNVQVAPCLRAPPRFGRT